MGDKNIPLNKAEPTKEKVKTMSKDNSKNKVKLSKEERKKIKEDSKLVTISYLGKDYKVPKTMVFESAKRDFKIKEDNKKIAQGEVAVLFLRESGIADLKYVKPVNGMFIVEGRYYHIIDSCIHSIGKKRVPLAVIPEWSFIPFSKKDYENRVGSKYQDAQQLIIKSIENAEVVKINQDVAPGGKANGKLIIWIIIGAVVAIFFFNKFFGAA